MLYDPGSAPSPAGGRQLSRSSLAAMRAPPGNFRRSINNYLALAASPDEQLDYEKRIAEGGGPGVVPWELIEMWFDAYHPKSDPFRNDFSEDELAALATFNELMESVAKKVPDDSVQAMLDHSDWQRVVEAANQRLQLTGDARDAL
jgi:hypothetical protein